MNVTQESLCQAIHTAWSDQTKYPLHKGWVRIVERLNGMYGLLLWSDADRELINDCETLMQVALQHNIWEADRD